jgi:predicted permease
VVERLRATPGVVNAGFGSTLPFLSRGNTTGYRVEGITPGPSEPGDALFRIMTAGYLPALGATLIDGRLPDGRDTADAPPVAVVNKSFAEMYWSSAGGAAAALGGRIALSAPDAPWLTIIGVVADVRENGYEMALKPGIYVLSSQVRFPADNLIVRTSIDPMALAGAVRQAVASVDPEQPVAALRTMEEIIGFEVVDRRQQSIVLSAFAGTALLLASIGIYGLVSLSVAMRRREVGLRTALGASVADVTRALVKQGAIVAGVGVTAGVTASLAGTRIMEGLLFGIEPHDPLTFAAISVVVATITVVACWLPARRAARMPPMIALRQE